MRVLSRNQSHSSRQFICDKCGSKLSSRQSFLAHFNMLHGSIKSYCDLCPRSFTLKSLLAHHIETKHSKLSLNCETCGYKSFDKKLFKIHMRIHGEKTECKVCHKIVANVKGHMRNHVKVKCTICSMILTKGSLLPHMKRHNNGLHRKKINPKKSETAASVPENEIGLASNTRLSSDRILSSKANMWVFRKFVETNCLNQSNFLQSFRTEGTSNNRSHSIREFEIKSKSEESHSK